MTKQRHFRYPLSEINLSLLFIECNGRLRKMSSRSHYAYKAPVLIKHFNYTQQEVIIAMAIQYNHYH